MASHRHRLHGSNASGGVAFDGLANAASRSIMGNTNAGNLAYVDANSAVPLADNTGWSATYNNMPLFLAIGNLFIYTGV